ncbi:MAG: hypothetical protein ACRDSH_01870 [Pseudonocardiaceae bacterium]
MAHTTCMAELVGEHAELLPARTVLSMLGTVHSAVNGVLDTPDAGVPGTPGAPGTGDSIPQSSNPVDSALMVLGDHHGA